MFLTSQMIQKLCKKKNCGIPNSQKRRGMQTLNGVLCIYLLRHLLDLFDSSWANVRRTEY